MSRSLTPIQKRGLLLKLAVVAVLLGGAGVLLLKGVDFRHLLEVTLDWIRSVGPVPFFVGLAILPALGFPLLAFTLSAGPVFGDQLGMPLVTTLVLVSLVINLALTYWLARYAFRPLLESLIKRLGYSLPHVAKDDQLSLAIVIRVTPGPPFFVQGYLLGLAKVPFRTYMVVSTLFAGSFSVAVLFFGDSLVNGEGKMAFLAFSALVVMTVLVQWVRRRYARRKLAEPV